MTLLETSQKIARTGKKEPHILRRIPPSCQICQRINWNDLLNNELQRKAMIRLFELGAERLVYETFEREVADYYLGREHYQLFQECRQ